jgi:hypothetical protein
MCLLQLAAPGVEGAEPQVAMRLQRAHAQVLGQGESLAVVASSLVDVQGLALHSNFAEEAMRMCLVAAPYLGTGELEKAASKRARFVHAADEEQGFAQLGEHKRLEDHAAPGGHTLQRLVQEREGLHYASGKSIRRSQDGSGYGE